MGDEDDVQRTVADGTDDSGVESPEWAVVKSLIDVENATTATMEEFLLHTTTDATDDLPVENLQERLDDLIAKQERAVAELELAKRALTELDAE
ncbi:hypothetical protein [Halobacterium zhouii]|uniref:hypothetical protein n=1 Tax=Halobacterium zhouii TaxID=2902624 RepID=UPI001E297066|nr:hypothetical protein [Halobacterium zhouii]